jgi:hypothetical protein
MGYQIVNFEATYCRKCDKFLDKYEDKYEHFKIHKENNSWQK